MVSLPRSLLNETYKEIDDIIILHYIMYHLYVSRFVLER